MNVKNEQIRSKLNGALKKHTWGSLLLKVSFIDHLVNLWPLLFPFSDFAHIGLSRGSY
jgi:hypothetical protein